MGPLAVRWGPRRRLDPAANMEVTGILLGRVLRVSKREDLRPSSVRGRTSNFWFDGCGLFGYRQRWRCSRAVARAARCLASLRRGVARKFPGEVRRHLLW